jgi:competence ComEA-like helix-hairpin-helix protein
MIWTPWQCRGLVVVLTGVACVLAVRIYQNPAIIPDSQPANPATTNLADRLDPNTATASELSAIPNIGPARAEAIVEYRNRYPGKIVFTRPEDLMRIKGIGPAIEESMEPYLIFPSSTH